MSFLGAFADLFKQPERKYGFKPDPNHFMLPMLSVPAPAATPAKFSLTPQLRPVLDQGQKGSCVHNAGAGNCGYLQDKENLALKFDPSRLFTYYNTRMAEGTVWSDAGSTISDYVASVKKFGNCPENGTGDNVWSYSDGPFKFRLKPDEACYDFAIKHTAMSSMACPQTEQSIKHVLLQGFPVILGFQVYSQFESSQAAATGMITMPGPTDQYMGGHGVLLCGWDDNCPALGKAWEVRNSYGSGWGIEGNFFIPCAYFLDPSLSSDLQVIDLIK